MYFAHYFLCSSTWLTGSHNFIKTHAFKNGVLPDSYFVKKKHFLRFERDGKKIFHLQCIHRSLFYVTLYLWFSLFLLSLAFVSSSYVSLTHPLFSPYPVVIVISSHSGLSPAQSEFNYLNTARSLELYGVELHYARVSKVLFTECWLLLRVSCRIITSKWAT